MSEYTVKNYTEQGGEVTHIGGKLVFDEGAELKGAGIMPNQAACSGTTAGEKAVNALLLKLKDSGLMEPDTWNLSVRLAPSLTDPVAAANNGKSDVALADGVITVTADVSELEESESSAPGQGTHKWVGLGIGTGLSSVKLAKYNGSPLTDEDASEAVSVGLDRPGEFVLYIRADEVVDAPKTITLQAAGYGEVTIPIVLIAPDAN